MVSVLVDEMNTYGKFYHKTEVFMNICVCNICCYIMLKDVNFDWLHVNPILHRVVKYVTSVQCTVLSVLFICICKE